MSTVSATQLAAYRLLRTQLYSYLDEAEFLAMKWSVWNDRDVQTARALIPDLVDVIRASIAVHAEDDDGQCELCEQPWPCRTVCTIHQAVVDPERHFLPLLAG